MQAMAMPLTWSNFASLVVSDRRRVVAARLLLMQRIPNPSHNTTVTGSLSFASLSG